MRVFFRVDASRVLASGHVTRCLTLARALAAGGAECRFACRALQGHMIEHIRRAGYDVVPLPAPPATRSLGVDPRLGVSEVEDARDTITALGSWRPDWIVVDHYALARAWEASVRGHCSQLMVIEDYVNRPHACDLLLNQNLGVRAGDYAPSLLPLGCEVLAGTAYALLRPEFAHARSEALARRQRSATGGRVLVTMGGVDPDNATGRVIDALSRSALPANWSTTVVMGGQAPHLEHVRAQIADLSLNVRLEVDTAEMARLMVEADLAIGAAGTTSWERCVLGLPSVILVLADNQVVLARALVAAGAARQVDIRDTAGLVAEVERLAGDQDLRVAMAAAAAASADGLGARRVVDAMIGRFTGQLEKLHDARQHD